MFWCGYMFLKINSTYRERDRDCASLHKFMSFSLHGIHLRPHFTSFIYGYKLIKGYLFFLDFSIQYFFNDKPTLKNRTHAKVKLLNCSSHLENDIDIS